MTIDITKELNAIREEARIKVALAESVKQAEIDAALTEARDVGI